MVLDEPTDSDRVFTVNGFTMVVDKRLLEIAKGLTVDYVDLGMTSGFQINSEAPIFGAGGGCGTSCSC